MYQLGSFYYEVIVKQVNYKQGMIALSMAQYHTLKKAMEGRNPMTQINFQLSLPGSPSSNTKNALIVDLTTAAVLDQAKKADKVELDLIIDQIKTPILDDQGEDQNPWSELVKL